MKMTVAEFVEKLKELPQDFVVKVIFGDNLEGVSVGHVSFIKTVEDSRIVWLRVEHDE